MQMLNQMVLVLLAVQCCILSSAFAARPDHPSEPAPEPERNYHNDRPSPPTSKSVSTSLQMYLFDNLKQDLSACVQEQDKDKAAADFINLIFSQCARQLNDIAACIKKAVSQAVGQACAQLSQKNIGDEFERLIIQAINTEENIQYAISKPIDVNNLSELAHLASSPSDIESYVSSAYACIEDSQSGPACSQYAPGYLSAGNSVCRSPCGRQGQSYSWCYLATSLLYKWEYCCEKECSTSSYTCASGTTYEYCGTYNFNQGDGKHAVNGKACLNNYPCGKHGYYKYAYWCYTDTNKNWDYCCAPGQKCADGWCYTGDGNAYWKYCKNPTTE